jgi:hypothetical protein
VDSGRSFELCLKEIELVQDQIARYDGNGLTIKSWCLTTCSALIAYAVVHRSALVAVIAMAAALAFAGTELVYRCIQIRFIARSMELERILDDGALETYRYRLPSSARNAHWPEEIRQSLRYPQFSAIYGVLILLSAVVAGAIRGGWASVLPAP